VIDGQRQVGVECLADRLAVVPGLGQRERLEVGFDAVGDLVEDVGAFGGRGLAHAGAAPWAASSAFSMSASVERGISVNVCPVTGVGSRSTPTDWRHPVTANEVGVARLVRHQRVCGTGAGINGHQ